MPETGQVRTVVVGAQALGMRRGILIDRQVIRHAKVGCRANGVAFAADKAIRFPVHPDDGSWTVRKRVPGAVDVIPDLKAGEGAQYVV